MSSNYLHGVETLELKNSSGQSRNTASAVLIVIEKRNLRKGGVCEAHEPEYMRAKAGGNGSEACTCPKDSKFKDMPPMTL